MNRIGKQLVDSLAPATAFALIRFLRLTMRLRTRNQEVLDRVRAQSGPFILAFWHSRWVMMPWVNPNGTLVVLHSRHRDSRMLGRMTSRFGIDQAWGSSSAGGAIGVRQLLRRIREGCDLVLTPDGPRGPRRRCQAGVVATARLSGKPIIPVAFSARPSSRLRSWDRTLVPWPFGRGLYLYGEPLSVPREADRQEQERLRLALERELNRLTDQADAALGLPTEERPSESPA